MTNPLNENKNRTSTSFTTIYLLQHYFIKNSKYLIISIILYL